MTVLRGGSLSVMHVDGAAVGRDINSSSPWCFLSVLSVFVHSTNSSCVVQVFVNERRPYRTSRKEWNCPTLTLGGPNDLDQPALLRR